MPNRVIKESVCTSDSIEKLTWFEECLFYRLIVNCDDYGRFDGRAAILKNRLFPLKENLTTKAVEAAVQKLANAGLVALYVFEGKPYLYLPTWNKHQTIRAKRSKYPAPTSENICMQMQADASKCSRNPIQSESNTKSESESKPAQGAFDIFWKAYPKKVGKLAAKKAFDRVKAPVETLVQAIERQKCGEQWQRDNGQYIPNPATWLNGGRWEDEVHLPPKGKGQAVRAASYDLSAFEELALFGGGKD